MQGGQSASVPTAFIYGTMVGGFALPTLRPLPLRASGRGKDRYATNLANCCATS